VSDVKNLWPIGTMALLAVGILGGQTATQHGLVLNQGSTAFQFPLMGNMRWTGTRLAGCDYCASSPMLWAVDHQGFRQSVAFRIPGADQVRIRDVAAGSDGSLVAVGLAISGDSRMGSFVGWISPDASQQVITRVWPYSPQAVTIAPDGSIWTVGAMMNANYRVAYPNLLRHYTPSGQLLASTPVRNTRRSNGGLDNVSSGSALMVSADRVGWLTMACQYIEFSLDGVQLGSYTCPNGYTRISDVSGVALSATDDLLVGGKWSAPLAPLQLDRAAGTWNAVPVFQDSGNTQMLLGFDGTTLMTSSVSSAMRSYTWAGQPLGGQ
jgi:hypothetical protein